MGLRMQNSFGRILRSTLRHRWTFIASVVCALFVAALWGGNIVAVFPVLKVVLKGESLQDWIGHEVVHAESALTQDDAQIAQLQQDLAHAAPDSKARLETALDSAKFHRWTGQIGLAAYRGVKTVADRFLPRDPLASLAVIMGLLMLGTAVKDIFLVTNAVLVSRLAEWTTFDLRKQFYRRTLRMDLATFNNEGTSDLISRFTNDMNTLSAGVTSLFGQMIREPLKGLACLILAGLISWRLLLLSLLLAPPTFLGVRWLAKRLKRANRRAMEEMA
jgi:ATP-binding cassette subfamily B protein/subfamily B ATP-binding cassette protein MsbA